MIHPLTTVGLSGETPFAVHHLGRSFVLKRFVPSTPRKHAEWVHRLMRHVRSMGVAQVPNVEVGGDGSTLQADAAGRLWELLEHMPGTATAAPTTGQVSAAAVTLARVHQAAAAFPDTPPRVGHSPGERHRIARAQRLLAEPWSEHPSSTLPDGLRRRWARAVALYDEVGGAQAVAAMARREPQPVALQSVLRDVWSDHILFQDDRVAGVVDWHAAGFDTPATDVARLWGSWSAAPGDIGMFVDAYAAVRPLSEQEVGLVPFLQASGVVFGLDNWFRWTNQEDRVFADMTLVWKRMDALLAALPTALEFLATRA